MNLWSGTLYNVLRALEKHHHEIICFGDGMVEQALAYSQNNFFEHKYIYYRALDYVPVFGKLLSEKIIQSEVDLVFFGDNYYVPYLDINNIPIVHLSDMTYIQTHIYKQIPLNALNKKALELERIALNKYTVHILSSEWVKRGLNSYYNIQLNKIHVIEFGANIPHPEKFQSRIDTDVCNLVFIGRNWEKKGGDKALSVYRKLKSDGFPCTLTIIGSTPPIKLDEDKDLIVIPFLDKTVLNDLNKLCDILYNSHFLILPTDFDAFGIVFCEASAYGVPSIAAEVGGVSQPVCEGKNGFLLPATATAEDYAKKIKSVFRDKESYLKLRASSRHEYETRLNWNVWGEKTNKILEKTVLNYKKKK